MKSLLAFALLSIVLVLPGAYASTASIEVNGNTHEITYEATGLEVEGLEADTNSELPSLTVFVSVTDAVSGTLDITFDRVFFDAVGENGDEDFLILADGNEIESIQSATATQRMLSITVPADAISLDIIGTIFGEENQMSPESEVPEETKEPPTVVEPVQESTTQCGSGTVLDPQTNTCILEATPEPEPTEEPAPVEETPETPEAPESQQCGPGTVLKDGQCVLDETCGPGTILKDGQCVLDTSAPTSSPTSMGKEFIVGIFAAFIIAFVVMIILWAIGRAGRRKN